MFRPHSGRPGTSFNYGFPGAYAPPAPRPPRPVIFGPVATAAPVRIPVATVAPVHHVAPVPAVNQCRLNTDTIIMTGVAGAVFAAPTGVGVIGGVVGGVLSGAVLASHEQKKCDAERMGAYRTSRRR